MSMALRWIGKSANACWDWGEATHRTEIQARSVTPNLRVQAFSVIGARFGHAQVAIASLSHIRSSLPEQLPDESNLRTSVRQFDREVDSSHTPKTTLCMGNVMSSLLVEWDWLALLLRNQIAQGACV